MRRGRAATAALLTALLAATATATAAGPAVAGPAGPPRVAPALAAPVTVTASADTYVVVERPTLSYGTQNKITAANWDTPWHSESYVRFAVPAVPAGVTIDNVRVEFTFERRDDPPASVQMHGVTGAWSETTTYATRPTVGALVTETVVDAASPSLSFDVTAAVQAPGEYSFALRNSTTQSVASLFSRESGANAPRLTVQYRDQSSTLCGASFAREGSETWQQALDREDGLFSGLEVVRVFNSGLPRAWPGDPNPGDRPVIVSFKAPPAQVIAGQHDAALTTWFANAPRDRVTWWSYFHEPEDNIQRGDFTAAQFRQAWQHLATIADTAGNPQLRATLILMGWTLESGSGRNWHDYYPGRDAIDVLGWDLYNLSWKNGNYRDPVDNFDQVVAVSQAEGLPFGIAETGTPIVNGDAAGRAAWLQGSIDYLSANGAQFIAYFDLYWEGDTDTIEYRLRDPAGQGVWRGFCS
jgi:hypothetical protein